MPNRSWFIIVLNRLAELCKDEQENKRIRILPCSMNRATQGSHWLDITGILGKDAFHHSLYKMG